MVVGGAGNGDMRFEDGHDTSLGRVRSQQVGVATPDYEPDQHMGLALELGCNNGLSEGRLLR